MTERLPLFPLGTVLVPGGVLPLHVFEPRYRDLVDDVLGDALVDSNGEVAGVSGGLANPGENVGPQFGVVAIRQGHEVGPNHLAGLYDVGCAAEVRKVVRSPDGRVELVTVGRRRFRLDGIDGDAGTAYLMGRIQWLDEPVEQVPVELLRRVQDGFRAYCDRVGLGWTDDNEPAATMNDPTMLSYLVAGSMLLHLPERQRLLAAPGPAVRLQRVAAFLHRETLLWRVVTSVPAVDLALRAADPR
jgi:uncharacterized protein